MNHRSVTLKDWPSLREYLQFAPHLVESIRFRPDVASKVDKLNLPPEIRAFSDPSINCALSFQVATHTLDETDLEDSLAADQLGDKLLVLDHLQDPHNLGAIIRTSAFFGVGCIVIAKNRQAPISEVAVTVARGGLIWVKVCAVTNLSRALETIKSAQYWVLGAEVGGVSARQLQGFYQRYALVLGSEGSGLSSGVSKRCDQMVCVHPDSEGPQSLNVSVACGSLLAQLAP